MKSFFIYKFEIMSWFKKSAPTSTVPSNTTRCYITELPHEMLLKIFQYLTTVDQIAVSETCSALSRIVSDHTLLRWADIFMIQIGEFHIGVPWHNKGPPPPLSKRADHKIL